MRSPHLRWIFLEMIIAFEFVYLLTKKLHGFRFKVDPLSFHPKQKKEKWLTHFPNLGFS